jgi:hypothetical protein
MQLLERRATSSHRINSWSIPLQHSDNLACLLLQQKAEHSTVVRKRRARENGLSSSLPHYDDDDDYKNHTESPPASDCQIVPRHEKVNRQVHTNKPSTSLQRNEQRYYCCSLFSRKTLCFLPQLDVLSLLVALRNPGTGVRERERERERERAVNGLEKKKRSQRESASCALACKRGAHTAKNFVLFCFVAVASIFLCASSLCRRRNNQFGLVWNLFLFLLGKAKQSFSGKS